MGLSNYEQEQQARTAKIIKGVIAGGVLLFVLLAVSCGAHTVGPGERGIKVTLGSMEQKSLPPGLYFLNPFTSHIDDMNVQTQKWEAETATYTRDVQSAGVHFALIYSLDPSVAHTVYQQVGTDWAQKLIAPVVNEQIKRVIGQYDAVDLISKRDEAARAIERDIVTVLGARHILATGFQMTNIDFTKSFEAAVEAKVVAQQKAIEEQNRTVQVEQQAKQTVISANAEAQSMHIRAQALESNPKLVEWEAVQKWDGKLPVQMLGGAPVPFISVK